MSNRRTNCRRSRETRTPPQCFTFQAPQCFIQQNSDRLHYQVFPAIFLCSRAINQHGRKNESDPLKTSSFWPRQPRGCFTRSAARAGGVALVWNGPSGKGRDRAAPPGLRGRAATKGGDQMEIRSTTLRAIRRSRRSYSAVVCGWLWPTSVCTSSNGTPCSRRSVTTRTRNECGRSVAGKPAARRPRLSWLRAPFEENHRPVAQPTPRPPCHALK